MSPFHGKYRSVYFLLACFFLTLFFIFESFTAYSVSHVVYLNIFCISISKYSIFFNKQFNSLHADKCICIPLLIWQITRKSAMLNDYKQSRVLRLLSAPSTKITLHIKTINAQSLTFTHNSTQYMKSITFRIFEAWFLHISCSKVRQVLLSLLITERFDVRSAFRILYKAN